MISKPLILKSTLTILSIVAFGVYFFFRQIAPSSLKINEVAFEKNQGLDWIEIYNPTINNLSLKNVYLSDDKKDFKKFQIKEDIIVPNQGFVVLYGKKADEVPDNSTILNFNISNGETLYLVSKNGSDIIDSITVASDKKATTGSTIGRFPDGYNEFFIISTATPRERNKKDFLHQIINK